MPRKKAVALGYNAESAAAPRVIASGQGLIAENIIRLADEYKVPLREDPVLVDALRQLQLGEEIPPELYQVVAEVLAFIMEIDEREKARS